MNEQTNEVELIGKLGSKRLDLNDDDDDHVGLEVVMVRYLLLSA